MLQGNTFLPVPHRLGDLWKMTYSVLSHFMSSHLLSTIVFVSDHIYKFPETHPWFFHYHYLLKYRLMISAFIHAPNMTTYVFSKLNSTRSELFYVDLLYVPQLHRNATSMSFSFLPCMNSSPLPINLSYIPICSLPYAIVVTRGIHNYWFPLHIKVLVNWDFHTMLFSNVEKMWTMLPALMLPMPLRAFPANWNTSPSRSGNRLYKKLVQEAILYWDRL